MYLDFPLDSEWIIRQGKLNICFKLGIDSDNKRICGINNNKKRLYSTIVIRFPLVSGLAYMCVALVSFIINKSDTDFTVSLIEHFSSEKLALQYCNAGWNHSSLLRDCNADCPTVHRPQCRCSILTLF